MLDFTFLDCSLDAITSLEYIDFKFNHSYPDPDQPNKPFYKDLPESRCVYFVFMDDQLIHKNDDYLCETLIYIGIAENLRIRWSDHHIYNTEIKPNLLKYNYEYNYRIYYQEVDLDRYELKAVEILLIRKFRPLLNKQFNKSNGDIVRLEIDREQRFVNRWKNTVKEHWDKLKARDTITDFMENAIMFNIWGVDPDHPKYELYKDRYNQILSQLRYEYSKGLH